MPLMIREQEIWVRSNTHTSRVHAQECSTTIFLLTSHAKPHSSVSAMSSTYLHGLVSSSTSSLSTASMIQWFNHNLVCMKQRTRRKDTIRTTNYAAHSLKDSTSSFASRYIPLSLPFRISNYCMTSWLGQAGSFGSFFSIIDIVQSLGFSKVTTYLGHLPTHARTSIHISEAHYCAVGKAELWICGSCHQSHVTWRDDRRIGKSHVVRSPHYSILAGHDLCEWMVEERKRFGFAEWVKYKILDTVPYHHHQETSHNIAYSTPCSFFQLKCLSSYSDSLLHSDRPPPKGDTKSVLYDVWENKYPAINVQDAYVNTQTYSNAPRDAVSPQTVLMCMMNNLGSQTLRRNIDPFLL